MALIICPECGKEYSDRAVCCPTCACPTRLSQKSLAYTVQHTSIALDDHTHDKHTRNNGGSTKTRRKKMLYTIIPITVGLLIVIVFVAAVIRASKKRKTIDLENAEMKDTYEKAVHLQMIGSFSEAKELFSQITGYGDASERETYCEAQLLCTVGNYSSAYELLKTIPDYEGTRRLLVHIYYETRFFEAIIHLRSIMKNPESLQLNSVKVYYAGESGLSYSLETPVFVSSTSGQNGFGGYSMNYECLYQSKGETKYKVLATCRSLDDDEYDSSSDDELIEWAGCVLIRGIMKNCSEIQDAMDFNRVNRIINSKNYLSIRRIDELDFRTIAEELLPKEANTGA